MTHSDLESIFRYLFTFLFLLNWESLVLSANNPGGSIFCFFFFFKEQRRDLEIIPNGYRWEDATRWSIVVLWAVNGRAQECRRTRTDSDSDTSPNRISWTGERIINLLQAAAKNAFYERLANFMQSSLANVVDYFIVKFRHKLFYQIEQSANQLLQTPLQDYILWI